MTIYAWLTGSSVDLGALVRLFPVGDPRVDRSGDEYYVTTAELDALFHEAGELLNVASSALRRMNGLARALDPSYRPVRLIGRFTDEAGTTSVVAVAETAEVRFNAFAAGVVTDGTGQGVPDPVAPAVRLIEAAAGHPDAIEVLELLGEDLPKVDWVDLYKVFEIVRDNAGGENALLAKPWVMRNEMKAFTGSANNPRVSGRDGRHARSGGGGKPALTMTIHEARTWISELVVAWLTDLATGP